jgi:hypothetical protein
VEAVLPWGYRWAKILHKWGIFTFGHFGRGSPVALTNTEIRRSKPGDKPYKLSRRRRSSRDAHSDRRKALAPEVPIRGCGKVNGAGPLPEIMLAEATHLASWIGRPSFERQRDFNPPQQRAVQRALPDCRQTARNRSR